MLLISLMQVVEGHDYWLAGAAAILAVVMFVLHRIRVRRFKLYDQAKTFD
jgi:hypothetical protein